jgi:teichoic acid transport system permease protein
MSEAPVVDSVPTSSHGLTRLGAKVPLGPYLREIWARREFATAVPLGELRAQNMDTVLGNLWHLLNPLLLVAVYYLIFGVLLDTDRGVDNFLTFLTVGVFTFHYSRKSVLAGSRSLVSNEGLIRSIKFPRAILPIATVIGETVAYLPALALMLVVAVATGVEPRLSWLVLVPVLFVQGLFNLGLVFVVARVTTAFRDVQNLLPFVFRLLFYVSGILYLVDRFVDDPLVLTVFRLNPFYAFPTLNRFAVLGMVAEPLVWVSALAWTSVLFVSGFVFFRAGEQEYGGG